MRNDIIRSRHCFTPPPPQGTQNRNQAQYTTKRQYTTRKALSNWTNTLRWGNKKRAPGAGGGGNNKRHAHTPSQTKPTHCTLDRPRAIAMIHNKQYYRLLKYNKKKVGVQFSLYLPPFFDAAKTAGGAVMVAASRVTAVCANKMRPL